ncbi:MAG: ABC transporter ATP-binding protein [Chloroflexi bacterium]|nr:ABC transporter ATP-binding protein [Chloroflexota bacterium]
MTKIAVRCTDLTKNFGRTPAVQGVNLEVEEGSFLALLGPSGCGKTTLLRLIAGFEMPDRGTVAVGERIVTGHRVFVPPEKRRVGIVFQDYALFTHLDVAANIGYGLPKGTNRQERVQEMLSLVGLKGLELRMPHELSGGEQQRVALARALAPGPEVLLLDEPFSNLDADLRARIRTEVKGILAYAGATVIFVTHDQEEAFFIGDRVGVMNAGRLEQIDLPEAIFHRPATPFVAQFVGTADFLAGEVQDKAIATELGRLSLTQELPNGTKIKVMVRPDFIDIRPKADGAGIIVERVFQGINYLYRVQLPSGATIQCQQHHNRSYSVDTRVGIKINPGHNPVYFIDRVENHEWR